MTHLVLVPVDKVDESWDEARAWIEQACRRGRLLLNAETIRDRCRLGSMQLWAAVSAQDASAARAAPGVEAIAVTEIIDYPLGRVCVLFIVTGRDRGNWLHHLAAIEIWARAQGCHRISSLARPGWRRVMARDPDYRITHILMEKDLCPAEAGRAEPR